MAIRAGRTRAHRSVVCGARLHDVSRGVGPVGGASPDEPPLCDTNDSATATAAGHLRRGEGSNETSNERSNEAPNEPEHSPDRAPLNTAPDLVDDGAEDWWTGTD
ncbi:hypothetical protein GCM10023107_37240 [Actinoplanes octamycinicus]|nr:hypothetical protein Aoc01nite_30440 [Actinoplanes octamycinicus]